MPYSVRFKVGLLLIWIGSFTYSIDVIGEFKLYDFVFFVGLLCFALSRHLTRPLQMLQQSVRTFAKGKLETRVDRSLQDRKDEFGELGREFDVMAERIDGLVSGEKRMLRDISQDRQLPLSQDPRHRSSAPRRFHQPFHGP